MLIKAIISVSERAALQKHETEHMNSCTQHDYQLSAVPTDSSLTLGSRLNSAVTHQPSHFILTSVESPFKII